MTKHSIAAFCALTLAAFGFAPTSHAAESPAPTSLAADDGKDVKETKELKEAVKQSCITGDLGVTLVSNYISRGILEVNQGVIAQPYLDLYFKLYEGTGFVNKVVFNIGLWSSIDSHVEPPGNTDTTRNWFEFDYTAGIGVTFAKNFTFTASYVELDSPSSSFDTSRNAQLALTYDDTDLLHDWALHPHFTWLAELDAQGFAGLQGHGFYYELGVAPGHTWGPVTLTIPLTLGLGSHGFYNQDTYGYFSAGAILSVPMSFVPECLGKWTFSGGYTYYNLGTQSADVTATGHHTQHVFQGTVGLTF